MATDNLMPQSSTSVIKHFMLRSSTTGQGLTGKVASDFSGKYNIAGGAEVTLSFSAGTAGDAYSSGKIVPLGLGKYAWHVPNAVFASLGNVSAVLSVSGAIDVHCEWLVVAAVRNTAAFGANTTTPPTAAANASQVRTELGTELGQVTTLHSRLTSTRAGNLDNLDLAISVIQSQITALNNLSAKANWFGALLLEVPDSGTRAYVYELVVKDDEDKLVNLDSSPTIALTNAAGTDRSALITTTIANPSTGRYTLTITVGTSTVNESLKLTASGTVSGEARYAVIAPQVVDYDNATQVALLLTRIGTPSVSISADIATRASQTSVDDLPTNAELAAALAASDDATLAAIADVQTDTNDIQARLPAALESGRIAAVLDSPTAQKIDDILEDTGTTLPAVIAGSGGSLTPEQQQQLDNIEAAVIDVPITVNNFGQFDDSGALVLKRGHTATITFTSTTNNLVPDMSAADTKVFFGIYDTGRRQWLQVEGTKIINTGLQSISFTIPADKAAAMYTGVHLFDAVVVYGYTAASGDTPATYTDLRPFASGNVRVRELSLDLTAL